MWLLTDWPELNFAEDQSTEAGGSPSGLGFHPLVVV